jgi:hypothetical protein
LIVGDELWSIIEDLAVGRLAGEPASRPILCVLQETVVEPSALQAGLDAEKTNPASLRFIEFNQRRSHQASMQFRYRQ